MLSLSIVTTTPSFGIEQQRNTNTVHNNASEFQQGGFAQQKAFFFPFKLQVFSIHAPTCVPYLTLYIE